MYNFFQCILGWWWGGVFEYITNMINAYVKSHLPMYNLTADVS